MTAIVYYKKKIESVFTKEYTGISNAESLNKIMY
jgi:hypothetical protein